MFPVQVGRSRQGDEELAPVCTWSTIGHGENAFSRVNEGVIKLVLEFAAEDGLAPTARACRIATLDHEVRNDAMEDYSVVFARIGETGEVLACL